MQKASHGRLLTLLLILCLTVAFAPCISAQETTAGIQGTVKDASGAVIANATVEVTGPALIGAKTMKADTGGYFRFTNLPPGQYMLTVTAPGFRTAKYDNIALAVGKLPTLPITMEVGAVSETIEVSGQLPMVDVTQSKVQVNVTQDVLENIPKGRSFQSLIAFAPGARYEPLQTCNNCPQGFQIDGASTSENSYLVEGQETSDIRSGQTSTNVPIEFIQEMQVKTSGFEAEYGGALGGVVNVVQKRGSNEWHGSVLTYYSGEQFDAAPNRTIRYVPNTSITAPVGSETERFDQPMEYYQPKKDRYRIIEPGFEVGGYLLKDRLWAFTSFIPRMERRTRTAYINFDPGLTGVTPIVGNRNFNYSDDTYYSLARLDYLATKKIRVYGAYQYSYEKTTGTPRITADSAFWVPGSTTLQYNTDSAQNPDNFFAGRGFVYPNRIWNLGGDITVTPSLVATARYGYSLYDTQARGRPTTGVRYQYVDTNYPYTAPEPAGATTPDIQGNFTIPQQFWGPGGFATMANNLVQERDRYTRQSLLADIAYFRKTSWGTHNFKGGYALNRLKNDPLLMFHDSYVAIGWNQKYFQLPVNDATCTAIQQQNLTLYGTTGTTTGGVINPKKGCIGKYGTFNIGTTTENNVPASSYNHSLYIQDAWTIGRGLTVNVGVRFDQETLPPYDTYLGNDFKGITFGFGDKVAPRLGASWDVFQNGKMKIFGSFGYFYDIMKYSLPRGSFGGDYWHDCVYTLDTPDISLIVPQRDALGHLCPLTGPAVNSSGQPVIPTTVGRFIENQDFRAPSNDPNNYLIDPNLKPMKQHESVIGMDWAITPNLGLETRWTRKRLDRTIEDAGLQTAAGETFYIVNPGYGIHKQPLAPSECVGCPTQPTAMRRYDGLEFRLTRRGGERWFGSVSYTYSRLYGNYAGLANSDTSDGRTQFAGRTDPNNNRSFDEPNMQFDSHGRLIDGPLATDRPHTFKAFGYYRLKWWKMETLLGGTQVWYSGSPVSSFVSAAYAPQFIEGRGKWVDLTQQADGTIVAGRVYDRRTPTFSQTDFNFVHEMHVSKTNENLRVGFEANIQNVFNQHSIVSYWGNMVRTGTVLPDLGGIPPNSVSEIDYHALMTGYNYVDAMNASDLILNSRYGMPSLWQDGRAMRFKFKFTF